MTILHLRHYLTLDNRQMTQSIMLMVVEKLLSFSFIRNFFCRKKTRSQSKSYFPVAPTEHFAIGNCVYINDEEVEQDGCDLLLLEN